MFKTTIKLKQHTPIIHFQHDQEGATLRATEVKPKLDEWLINKKGGWAEVPVGWKNKASSKGKESLSYKLKLTPTKAPNLTSIKKGENIVQFFGNMGNDYNENKKAFSFLDEDNRLSAQFFAYDSDLIEFLDTQFPKFIAETNFGARQNKGYGSFSAINEKGDLVVPEECPCIGFQVFREDKRTRQKKEVPFNEKWKDIMVVVNFYYQRLKSGINYCRKNGEGVYHHSYLKEYFSKNNPQARWEKRWLKETFLNLAPDNSNKYFVRALLGLPYQFTFKPKNPNHNCNPNPSVYPPNEINIEVRDPSKEISRIKSPITFKPIIQNDSYVRVYIIVNEYKQPTNHTFQFGSSVNQLHTPPKPIDLVDLINSYHNYLGNSFIAEDYTGKTKIQVRIYP